MRKLYSMLIFDVQSDVIVDNRLSRNPIWLEDVNGNNLMSEDKPFAERIKGNCFKQEFSTGKKAGLQLKTYKQPKPLVYEKFEIQIP